MEGKGLGPREQGQRSTPRGGRVVRVQAYWLVESDLLCLLYSFYIYCQENPTEGFKERKNNDLCLKITSG